MKVAVALPAHVALVHQVAVQAAIASVVDGDLLRRDELALPPVVAGVWQTTCLDFLVDPKLPERTAELIDEHLLQSLEEVLRDFEQAAKLGAGCADEDHECLGWQSNTARDFGDDIAHEWLE